MNKKLKEIIDGIIGIILFFGLIWFLISISGGSFGESSCGLGSHYEEDFRGTIGGCVPD